MMSVPGARFTSAKAHRARDSRLPRGLESLAPPHECGGFHLCPLPRTNWAGRGPAEVWAFHPDALGSSFTEDD